MFAEIRSVHFMGICGTAMASAAVAMKEKGFIVTGSDENAYPPMSTFLASRQIEVMTGYAEKNLAQQPDLVVVGNAISRGNPEAEAVLEQKRRYCSLPELLKEFFIRGKRSLVVTGTHGKTTTASLLAWVFEHNGFHPSFLIGGLPLNLGQGARFTASDWFIIEGDEYDTAFFDKRSKFVHYLPEVVIVNNLEFDHADIFDDLAAIQKSFRRLFNLIPRNGLLLANGDEPNLAPLLDHLPCPLARFGLASGNDWQAVDCHYEPEASGFQLREASYRLGLVGEFNVRNALAVAACAIHCGLTPAQIQSAFGAFAGVRRRMERRGVAREVTVVDDFGHHPTAIRETLRALRVKYPGQRIWAVFEPRSNTTRRRIFQHELAAALAGADLAVIAEPNRLELLAPQERLDPEQLLRDLNAQGTAGAYLPGVPSIVQHIAASAQRGDVVCVFSNGGFGGIHEKLLDALRARE
jgi:UDP-N-acetylmuramate: L-alanyl-gamma-D-glutamyl-meso-diaminopimelate ligase